MWVMGYANDVMAYIPSARVLKEGGYEADSSQIYYGMPGKSGVLTIEDADYREGEGAGGHRCTDSGKQFRTEDVNVSEGREADLIQNRRWCSFKIECWPRASSDVVDPAIRN